MVPETQDQQIWSGHAMQPIVEAHHLTRIQAGNDFSQAQGPGWCSMSASLHTVPKQRKAHQARPTSAGAQVPSRCLYHTD